MSVNPSHCNLSPLLESNSESYYWIGFIMADGWIDFKRKALFLCSAAKDLDHLRRFAEFIHAREYYEPTNTKHPGFDSSNKEMYRVRGQHPAVVTQLIERFSLVPKKTYNPPDISYVLNSSDDLFLAFLAGFIDGDGSIISVPSCASLTLRLQNHLSWKSILELLENRLYVITGDKRSTAKMKGTCLTKIKGNTALLSIGRYSVLKSLHDRVIALNLPLLKRKWDKIEKYPGLYQQHLAEVRENSNK